MTHDQLRVLTILLDLAAEDASIMPYAALMPLARQASYLSGMLFGEIEERDETGRDLD